MTNKSFEPLYPYMPHIFRHFQALAICKPYMMLSLCLY